MHRHARVHRTTCSQCAFLRCVNQRRPPVYYPVFRRAFQGNTRLCCSSTGLCAATTAGAVVLVDAVMAMLATESPDGEPATFNLSVSGGMALTPRC